MAHHNPPVPSEAMSMTFFTSTSTPLYTASWQPRTQTQYAVTCLFIVLLCVVSRCLGAVRHNLASVIGHGDRGGKGAESVSCYAEVGGEKQDKNGDGDSGRGRTETRDLGESLLGAGLDVVLVGVGYLM